MLDTLKFFLFVILLLITILLNQNVISKKSGERDLSQFWRLENSNGSAYFKQFVILAYTN